MSLETKNILEFGSYRIDLEQRLLTKGNHVIPLAPKVFDILLVLVENGGRIVEKEDLLKRVWPDTFVEEGSLTRNISTLRKALGENPDDQKYIATIPKRGYRFGVAITKVQANEALPDQQPNQSRSHLPTAPGFSAPTGLSKLPGISTSPVVSTAPVVAAAPEQRPGTLPRKMRLWPITAGTALLSLVFATMYFLESRRAPSEERSVRFLVTLPESAALSNNVVPALSPDGEKLAFGGVEADGKTRLFIRPLSSLAAKPVAGSEGVVAVFWSPDSRSVGFFAGGKLKRSDLVGGPPQILCDASASLRPGGTWNRDGLILFNSEDRRGLYLVSANGGAVRPATALDPARQEMFHAWPKFLPDGRHFLYLVESQKPENTGIYAGSLDSKPSKLVVHAETNPSYAELSSGAGYLLFMQAATLMAQRFDAGRLELQGNRFPVAEQMWLPPAPARGFAAFSASANGVLSYRTLSQTITELVWFDRQGRRQGRVGEPLNYAVPALSSDEKTLAITRMDIQLGSRDIWLFDLPHEQLSRFTFDPAHNINPTWSPDGAWIAFSSYQKGNLDIYRKRPVPAGPNPCWNPASTKFCKAGLRMGGLFCSMPGANYGRCPQRAIASRFFFSKCTARRQLPSLRI